MLVSMLVFLLAAVGVPRTRWLLFVLPLIVGYTVATGARPSAIRAGIMAVVFLSAPLLGRRGDGVASLALAAVLIALWNPQQLLDVGAIYSFTVVTGIMILYPVLMRRAAGLWERDPVDVTPEPLLSRISRRMCKVVMSLSVVASAAWISSIPLTAHYFGRISLVAVPCNLLVIPAAFLTLTSSMLALIASGVSTPLADLFNNANAALVTMLLGVLRPLAALPWSCLDVPSIPIWCIPAWYVAVWGGALALRRSD
jgi:competence protein ComEC